MPDLIPFEIQVLPLSAQSSQDWRTVYCFFAFDAKDAKSIGTEICNLGRVDIYNVRSHRIKKHVAPKTDFNPRTGKTDFPDE